MHIFIGGPSLPDVDPSSVRVDGKTLITGFTINVRNEGKQAANDIESCFALFSQRLDKRIQAGLWQDVVNPVSPGEIYHHSERLEGPTEVDKLPPLFAVFQLKYKDPMGNRKHARVFFLKWSAPENVNKFIIFEGVSRAQKAKILEYLKAQKFEVLEEN